MTNSTQQRLWQVHATVERTDENGWTSSPQAPTFYVEACCATDAAYKARRVLNPHRDQILIPHMALYCEATGEYFDPERTNR